MRIIHILDRLSQNYTSGIANHVLELASFQRRGLHEVRVVTYLQKREANDVYLESYEGVKIHNVEAKSGHDLKLSLRLFNIIKEFKPEIVHYHVLPFVGFLAHLFKRNYKIINTFHVIEAVNTHEMFWRYFLDGIVPVSPTCMKYHNPEGKKYRHSVWRVIYIGINKSKYVCQKKNDDYSILNLIMVCRVDKMKNPDHGVLIAKILNENYNVKTRLTVVGNGDYEDGLKQFVKTHGSESYVELTGFSRDPVKYLAGSHLFLTLSWWEAFCLSALEAIACGIPVISYQIKGGFMDWFEDQKCGILSKENTPESIASIIYKLYNNKPRLNQLRDGACEVGDKYDAEIKSRELESFYKEILSRNET